MRFELSHWIRTDTMPRFEQLQSNQGLLQRQTANARAHGDERRTVCSMSFYLARLAYSKVPMLSRERYFFRFGASLQL